MGYTGTTIDGETVISISVYDVGNVPFICGPEDEELLKNFARQTVRSNSSGLYHNEDHFAAKHRGGIQHPMTISTLG